MLFLLVGILRVGRWGIIQGQNVHTSFRENTLTDVKVGRHTHTHIFTAWRLFLGKKVKTARHFHAENDLCVLKHYTFLF